MSKTSIPYDVTVFDKAESPFAKRFRELAINPSALKEFLGCSLQAINQYKQGTAFPKTENLIKIADFYGVSVDYLLGRTEVRSMDGNIQAAHTLTGLSEVTLNLLNEWKQSDDRRRYWPDYISAIVEDNESDALFGSLSDIMGSALFEAKAWCNGDNNLKSHRKDMRIAALWYIAHHMTNIIERQYIAQLERDLQEETEKGGKNGKHT